MSGSMREQGESRRAGGWAGAGQGHSRGQGPQSQEAWGYCFPETSFLLPREEAGAVVVPAMREGGVEVGGTGWVWYPADRQLVGLAHE